MIDYKKALLLAGQVALKSRAVINANVKNLSWRTNDLEVSLDEYDEYIISNNTLKSTKKGLVGELTKLQSQDRGYFKDLPIGTKFIITEEMYDSSTYDLIGYFLYYYPQNLKNPDYHYTGFIEKNTYKIIGTMEDCVKNNLLNS